MSIAGSFLALALVLGAAMVVAPSIVFIENSGSQSVQLNVSTTDGRNLSWQGELKPGQRVIRAARFSDNGFNISCRDADGVSEKRNLGYVTGGMKWLITVKASGCQDVDFEYQSVP